MPELPKLRQAVLRRVAGDESCIDGANGSADDPVGLHALLVQRLIDAALISAKRSTALQHEHDLAVVVVADLVHRFQRAKSFDGRHDHSSSWARWDLDAQAGLEPKHRKGGVGGYQRSATGTSPSISKALMPLRQKSNLWHDNQLINDRLSSRSGSGMGTRLRAGAQ